jgi:hypothetical protein
MISAITGREHWDKVYWTMAEDKVSWFEAIPDTSIGLIEDAQLPKTAPIIDVGGGLSRLADELIARGYVDVTVLDISAEAASRLAARLGPHAPVKVIVADVTSWQPDRLYQVWHDRAVLHFLVNEADQAAYRTTLLKALSSDGHAIILGFGKLGPAQCSGLPVRRYDEDDLVTLLGDGLQLVEACNLDHRTPAGAIQRFFAAHFVRRCTEGSDASDAVT